MSNIVITNEERAALVALLTNDSRQRLAPFGQFVRRYIVRGAFYELLCDHLEAILRGDIRRLAIFAPPQHGKSTLASEIFPSFWLAKQLESPMILASYNDMIATEKAGFVRDIVQSEEYQLLFPHVKLREDSRAKSQWLLDGHQGGMRAAGIGGSLTGRPGGFAIIDDPIKGWEEAQSPVLRETAWRWYDSVLRTRLWETAPLTLIQTRWHEDDLAGRILNSKEAKNWTVLRLPALAETQAERDDANRRINLPLGLPDPLLREPDQALAEYRYSATYLRELRDTMTYYTWFAEYQGSPRPLEGNRIKRSMIKIASETPEPVSRRIRFWDCAATEGGGARTAGVLIAKSGNNFYVEDVVFGQWGAEERNAMMLQTATLDAMRFVTPTDNTDPKSLPGWNSVNIYIEREPGSSGKDAIRAFREVLDGFPVYDDPPTGSKDVRFEVVASAAAAGRFFMRTGSWSEAYMDEIVSVPNGLFRDMADATAAAIALLSKGGLTFGYLDKRPDADAF